MSNDSPYRLIYRGPALGDEEGEEVDLVKVDAYRTAGAAMQKWEYKVDCLSGAGLARMQHILNRYGQEGWELVGFAEDEFIFKRPIPADIPFSHLGTGAEWTPGDTQALASVTGA